MRVHTCFAVFVAVLAVVALPALAQRRAPDVTGAWLVDLDPDFGGNPDTVNCTFKQDGEKLTGAFQGHGAPEPEVAIVGNVKDRKVTFQFQTGRNNDQTETFTAMLNDQASTMKGEWHFDDAQRQEHQGKFSGRKQK
jgi:hypothetical protein